MQTKWTIFQAKLTAARAALAEVEAQITYMETTPFGRPCSACGTQLDTEADFARHFTVPDVQYYNLGSCPNNSTSARWFEHEARKS